MRGALAVLAAVAALAGCRESAVLVDAQPPVDTTGNGGGAVQRTTLTVTVRVEPEDSAVYRALGWTDGLVPGASIVLRRSSGAVVDTALTDSAGMARFRELLPGPYSVSALRILGTAEVSRLRPEDADVSALAGAAPADVAAPGSVVELRIPPGRRGSLVVSEWFNPFTGMGEPFYPYGGWLEVYNNTDTTIYLDGKLVGQAAGVVWLSGPYWPCANYEIYNNDSLGLWVWYLYRFPGTGTEHPLEPGRAVVIAVDAIDHTEVIPWLDDMRSADFELPGDADVDNPSVPNLVDENLIRPAGGHGMGPSIRGHALPFIAMPLDIATLPSAILLGGKKFVRVPREAILDFAMLETTEQYGFTLCEHIVHRDFDRQIALILGGDRDPHSYRRRVLRIEGGRAILQRTLTSARDWEPVLPRTPGRVP